MIFLKKFYLCFIIILLLFSSCYKNKHKYISNLTPLYDSVNQENKHFNKGISYKINEDDRLYIKIFTMDKDASKFFNNENNSQNANMNAQNLMFTGYTVDKFGYVDLPILKKIKVINLNMEETQLLIQSKANEYLKDATVIVKLLSFQVFFIGEINRTVTTYDTKLNIFDAISLAGGIPYSADKENVIIIRSTKNGRETFKINLTKKSLLASPSFFLQPNDIIHVAPHNSKIFQVGVSEYLLYITTITSVITSLILVLSFLK